MTLDFAVQPLEGIAAHKHSQPMRRLHLSTGVLAPSTWDTCSSCVRFVWDEMWSDLHSAGDVDGLGSGAVSIRLHVQDRTHQVHLVSPPTKVDTVTEQLNVGGLETLEEPR